MDKHFVSVKLTAADIAKIKMFSLLPLCLFAFVLCLQYVAECIFKKKPQVRMVVLLVVWISVELKATSNL